MSEYQVSHVDSNNYGTLESLGANRDMEDYAAVCFALK